MSPAFGLNVRTVMSLRVCSWSRDFTRSRSRERDKTSVRHHPTACSAAGSSFGTRMRTTPHGGYRACITWSKRAWRRPCPVLSLGPDAHRACRPVRPAAGSENRAGAFPAAIRVPQERPVTTAPTRKNTGQRIPRRAQRYARGMNYPGDQVTAPPDQWWRYQSGQDAYVPVQAGFDSGPHQLTSASGGYAASARNGQSGSADTGYAPPASRGNSARPGTGNGPPRSRRNAAQPETAETRPADRWSTARPETPDTRPRSHRHAAHRPGDAPPASPWSTPRPGTAEAPHRGRWTPAQPVSENVPPAGRWTPAQPRPADLPPACRAQAARAGAADVPRPREGRA